MNRWEEEEEGGGAGTPRRSRPRCITGTSVRLTVAHHTQPQPQKTLPLDGTAAGHDKQGGPGRTFLSKLQKFHVVNMNPPMSCAQRHPHTTPKQRPQNTRAARPTSQLIACTHKAWATGRGVAGASPQLVFAAASRTASSQAALQAGCSLHSHAVRGDLGQSINTWLPLPSTSCKHTTHTRKTCTDRVTKKAGEGRGSGLHSQGCSRPHT